MANCLFERYQASNVKYEAAKLCLKSIKTEMITLLRIITVGLLTTGKNKNQEKMAKLPKTRHIIPVRILPVPNLSILKLQNIQK